MKRLAIIAGKGHLPLDVAKTATADGYDVLVQQERQHKREEENAGVNSCKHYCCANKLSKEQQHVATIDHLAI